MESTNEICDVCGMKFLHRRSLIGHREVHKNNIFPVMFPEICLTRKMVEMSLVMPKFIRDHPGLLNKILRLGQEGEHIHALMNRSESKFKSTKDKSERYWQMLKYYENKLYTSK